MSAQYALGLGLLNLLLTAVIPWGSEWMMELPKTTPLVRGEVRHQGQDRSSHLQWEGLGGNSGGGGSDSKSCLTLCDPMGWICMPCSSVLPYLLEFAQTHVH